MKKSKFTAWVMAIALLLAPGASAYAEDTGTTTPTPAPTDSTTTPDSGTTTPDSGTTAPDSGTTTPDGGTTTPDGGTTTPDGGTTTPDGGTTTPDGGTVCTQIPSDDDSGDDSDETGDDSGDVKTGDGTETTPTSPSTPAPQVSDRSGYQNIFAKNDKGRNDHNGKKDDHKPQAGQKGDDKYRADQEGTDSGTTTCYKHDNGKHKGWTNKISNMLKHLDQLKQEADSLQKQLDRLKEWAKTNGSTSDLDALNQILDALSAKDDAGEADSGDLIVLAETQDQLNDTAGSVQTLEKALTTNYTDDNVYKLLSSKLVKSGQKGVKVYVKGKKPQFDVQPIVVDGRTLVPFRAIGDALQAQVQWDPATQTVTLTNKDGKVVKLQIGNKQATVDGKPVILEVPATVVNDRTLVPLRALADFFNLQVNWDDAAEMAILK